MSWIKIRKDIHEDPAVIAIAAALAIDEFQVVGCLVRVWSWVDGQSRSGHAPVPHVYIDRLTRLDGFAKAMVEVGWLERSPKGEVVFPNYDRHMSQSAKQRALATIRKRNQREQSGHDEGVTETRQERDQRREEKKVKKNKPPPSSSVTPTSIGNPDPPGMRGVVEVYDKIAGKLSSAFEREALADLIRFHGDTKVRGALEETGKANATSPLKYLDTVLRNGPLVQGQKDPHPPGDPRHGKKSGDAWTDQKGRRCTMKGSGVVGVESQRKGQPSSWDEIKPWEDWR